MLKRNVKAIVCWGKHRSRDRGPSCQGCHPLKLDNGIWDLVANNFPEHNVIPMDVYGYYEYAKFLIPICIKGKSAMINIYNDASIVAPSVILDNVTTGQLYLSSSNKLGFVFPYFENMISFSNVVHEVNWDSSAKARKYFSQIADGDLSDIFKACVRATYELNYLGLTTTESYGNSFYFGANSDEKVQILLDPCYLRFVGRDNIGPIDVDEMLTKISNMWGKIDFDSTSPSVKGSKPPQLHEVVNYDLPEWKAKTETEAKNVIYLISTFLTFYSVGGVDGLIVMDRLMCLICFGYVEELVFEFRTEKDGTLPLDTNIDQLFDVINTKFLEHINQMPYDRISLDDLNNGYPVEKKDLQDPNSYRKLYDSLMYNETAESHATLAPGGKFYRLEEMYDVEDCEIDGPVTKVDEYPLDVYFIAFANIIINGMNFRSSDLIIFYNTQFYDLITALTKAGESQINLSYISIKDIELMRELLEGRIMPQTFRQELSKNGVVFLGGNRTFYQLTERSDGLQALNSMFSFGRRFVQQIRTTARDVYKIDELRWNEFLEIVGS